MRFTRRSLPFIFGAIITISFIFGAVLTSEFIVPAKGIGNSTINFSTEPTPMPEWKDIDFFTANISQIEIPDVGVNDTAGMQTVVSNPTFYPEKSVNATAMKPSFGLRLIESFNTTCVDTTLASSSEPLDRFSIRYFSPLANETYLKSIRVTDANDSWYFTGGNLTFLHIMNALRWVQVNPLYWRFNLSRFTAYVNKTVFNGLYYNVELEHDYPVTITPWTMESLHTRVMLDNNQSNVVANYSLTLTFSSRENINLTYLFAPISPGSLFNVKFYQSSGSNWNEFNATFDPDVNGWEVTGSGKIATDGTKIKVTFSINFTVAFINVLPENDYWTDDELVYGVIERVRGYTLDITSGPEKYLLEKVRFNAPGLPYSDTEKETMSKPSTTVSVIDNAYTEYDPELEQDVQKLNGTGFQIAGMQKQAGPLYLDVGYLAKFNATLHVLDEVRNPLVGADLYLYYQGVRFGSLMAQEDYLFAPAKVSDSLGLVTFHYLPEGNYSVKVLFQGTLVQTFNFTLNQANTFPVVEITTIVPYEPTILVIWICLFVFIAVIGFSMQRKR